MRSIKISDDSYHKKQAMQSVTFDKQKSLIMLQAKLEEYAKVPEVSEHIPCISLIMPFEPKMSLENELALTLKIAIARVEDKLLENYPEDIATPVLIKLKQLIKDLNYHTHKISIAIFVSPLIEKVYYLDIAVEEKIIIDDSFEIRDLIYGKKEIHKYLLAVLSSKYTKIFSGNTTQFIKIVSNVPDNVAGCKNDAPENVGNFCDEYKQEEILLDKFLHHADSGISLLLQSCKFPIFIMGTPKTIEHFKSITHNAKHVVEYILGNYDDKTEAELHNIMEPYVADWKKVMHHDLLKKMDEAVSHKKLATGIEEVWKEATQKRGKLLLVEKNFMYPALQSTKPEIIYSYDKTIDNNAFYIKDAVDDVIEKVLAGGGDVEFVDEGFLTDYGKIVLIEYYHESGI